jgi:hypothetical protein
MESIQDDSTPPVRRPTRHAAVLAAVVIAIAAVACGDPYLHTNPYDPVYPVTVNVVGPDTVFSYQEIAQYSGTSDPVFPDTAFQVGVSDSIVFVPAGVGGFRAAATPLWPAYRTVSVLVGLGAIDTFNAPALAGPAVRQTAYRHTATKIVVVTQRVVRIQLRCPDTHACDTVSAGGAWSVWTDGLDANNQEIVALHSLTANPATGAPVATFTIRDTTVATFAPVGIRAATVTALKTGTTWIVGARGELLDSLQLVVR